MRTEIRRIREADNDSMAAVVRQVMREFGAVGEGFSSEDAEIDSLFEAYQGESAAYFVALSEGAVIGGGGIGPLEGASGEVCELRKLYVLPQGRGLGIGRALLHACLRAATECGYRRCYLETSQPMQAARALYEAAGFQEIQHPMGNTGHCGCDQWYVMELPLPDDRSAGVGCR